VELHGSDNTHFLKKNKVSRLDCPVNVRAKFEVCSFNCFGALGI